MAKLRSLGVRWSELAVVMMTMVVLSSGTREPLNPITIEDSPDVTGEGDFRQMAMGDSRAGSSLDPVWPADLTGIATIKYRLNDALTVDKDYVRRSIQTWMDGTCIFFEEVSSGEEDLLFTTDVDSPRCSSFIGYRGFSIQAVQLAPDCIEDGNGVLHVIGHALGLRHEETRSDRDDYIEILKSNMNPSVPDYVFEKLSSIYSIPYDYASIMHSPPRILSLNGEPTIVTVDPRMMALLGNDAFLTFMDIKLANIMYKCIDLWQSDCSAQQPPNCQSGGYLGKNCECVCPDGSSGPSCESVAMSYNDALLQKISPLTENITSPATISTPGYPTPVQDKVTFMKILTAPEGYNVKLVIEDFDLPKRNGSSLCTDDYLAIYETDYKQIVLACDTDLYSGEMFFSEDSVLMLEYRTYNYSAGSLVNMNRGFLATMSFVPNNSSEGRPTELIVDSQSGGCSLINTGPNGTYLFQSPNYPDNYGMFDGCNFKLHTNFPCYMKVTVLNSTVKFLDQLGADMPFFSSRSYNFREVGQVEVLPTSDVTLRFGPGLLSSGKFNLLLEVIFPEENRIYKLQQGDSGWVSLPSNYGASTVYEWWFEAPEDAIFALEIQDEAYIYKNSSPDSLASTRHDYLMIEKKNWLGRDLLLYGAVEPQNITIPSNKMKMIFYGEQGGENSFNVRYSVV